MFSFFIHLQDHRGRRSGKGSMRYLDTGDRYQVRLQSNTLCNCAMQNTRKGILPLFFGQLPSKITFDIPSLKGIEEHILTEVIGFRQFGNNFPPSRTSRTEQNYSSYYPARVVSIETSALAKAPTSGPRPGASTAGDGGRATGAGRGTSYSGPGEKRVAEFYSAVLYSKPG